MFRTLALLIAAASALAAQPAGDLADTIRPFVSKNCQRCHNSALSQGSIDLQQMTASADSFSGQRSNWELVMSALRTGEMPPAGQPRPAQADIDAFSAAVDRSLAAAAPPPEPSRQGAIDEPVTRDWLTYGYDPERTGWARGETALTKNSVGRLGLLWKTQLDAVPNRINVHATLTDALVDGNTVIVAGGANEKNSLYALDTATGKIVWQKDFPNNQKPPQAPNNACPNNLNATPVIDKTTGTVYVLPDDGRVRGIKVSNGEEVLPGSTRGLSNELAEPIATVSIEHGTLLAVQPDLGGT